MAVVEVKVVVEVVCVRGGRDEEGRAACDRIADTPRRAILADTTSIQHQGRGGLKDVCLPPDGRTCQARHRAQRRLRGVEAEAEILVAVGDEDIGRLVPLWIPAVPYLDPAFVLAETDGRYQVLGESVFVMCGPTAAG